MWVEGQLLLLQELDFFQFLLELLVLELVLLMHAQGVGDDEGHPADQQEGTQDDGGHVLEHGVHGGLWLGRSRSQLFFHILR
jgi:hypothetical protein